MQEKVPQFQLPKIDKVNLQPEPLLESIEPKILEYATQIAREEKLHNSYKVIDPSDVHFVREYNSEFNDGEEEDKYYSYNTTIDDINYNFTLHVIDGVTSEWDEEKEQEITSSYHCGRIDFSVEGSEFIVNIGLEKIHKTDELIKDLFKFIYSKNKASYLVVDASKLDLTLPKSEEEAIAQVKSKIIQLKEGSIENINLNEFYFPENSENLDSVSINNNEVCVSHIDGRTERMEIADFLHLLESKSILENSVLRNAAAVILVSIGAGGDKKQQQRLNLYERRLGKMGFLINRKSDRIYANVTDQLLENLYDFSTLSNDTEQLLKKYIAETGNNNPTVSDLRDWKYPDRRASGAGRRGINRRIE